MPPAAKEERSKQHSLQLEDCFLAGANLRKAFLNNADLVGANLNGANLAGADLTAANVEAAVYLPPSVTEALFGPDSQRLQVLKEKYPHYNWQAAKARGSDEKR